MKKLFVASAMALCVFGASAQTKIGYINTEELIGQMPEAVKIDNELKEFQASLAQQGQDMMKDLGDKDSIFVKDSAKLSQTMKDIKRAELIKLYQEVQGWNQQAQDAYQVKAQEKIMPLRAKAQEAINAAAKENGYIYVLDSNSILVGPPGDNILPMVKRKLGIKDTPVQKPPVKTPVKN
ncbi:MAG: OmpH family outer membrane protein [Ferruginibacter sp.]